MRGRASTQKVLAWISIQVQKSDTPVISAYLQLKFCNNQTIKLANAAYYVVILVNLGREGLKQNVFIVVFKFVLQYFQKMDWN
ncbi:hypothetical protein MHK_008900 [Candidatus Magnetomorum sp. HK-1]|nr:hypothetical protein MHK_008900 [Candidatus Magnetomorum sp. HK-1]